MNLDFSAEDDSFRAEVRGWLGAKRAAPFPARARRGDA